MFSPDTPADQIIAQVARGLMLIRAAQHVAEDLHGWQAAVSVADLTAAPPDGPGMRPEDASDVLSACADMFGLSELYMRGETTQTFPPGYIFGAAARRVISSRVG